ncbi:MAG TPA: hypothetical protein VL492_12160 [Methylovirgula sp.]|jgi:hypothetical protein|nr:hypothetical protein [Methylovirgula sp.]
MTFLDEMRASFPPGLSLPAEFETLFTWMEATGFVHDFTKRSGRYASLYPSDESGTGTSLVTFTPVDRTWAEGWTGGNAAASACLAPLLRTGGDGSYAAIWKDDVGQQRFVHLGSGSGSTMLCTLVDNPVDFLRLVAIGYEELCWPEVFHLTPEAAYDENHDEDDPPYQRPVQFREWVERTFKVSVPETAAELVRKTAEMRADETSDDPFFLWIRRLQGW